MRGTQCSPVGHERNRILLLHVYALSDHSPSHENQTHACSQMHPSINANESILIS